MTTATTFVPEKALGGKPAAAAVALDRLRYYNFRRRWTKRIVPHLADEKLNAVLVRDFNKYTYVRWGERFLPGHLPSQFESCGWRCWSR